MIFTVATISISLSNNVIEEQLFVLQSRLAKQKLFIGRSKMAHIRTALVESAKQTQIFQPSQTSTTLLITVRNLSSVSYVKVHCIFHCRHHLFQKRCFGCSPGPYAKLELGVDYVDGV